MHTLDLYELRDKVRAVLDGLAETELNPRFARDGYNVELFDVMFSPELEEVTVNLGYVTDYYEISEAVASGVELRCAEDDLSPEECEELYEQAYKDELEELNNECVIRLSKKMEFPDLGASVEIYPAECDGDYCSCGAGISIKIKMHGVNTVEDAVKRIVDTTRAVLDRILPEVINA